MTSLGRRLSTLERETRTNDLSLLSEEELWERLIDCTLSLPASIVHRLLTDEPGAGAPPLVEVERMLATEDRLALERFLRVEIERGGSAQSIERILEKYHENSL